MKTWTPSIRSAKLGGLVVLFAIGGVGCDKPRAQGDANQILVAAPQELWNALEEDLKEALEPRTFTVRDERVFDVAHIDPQESGWGNLRVMRQVLLIGDGTNPIVAEALERYRGTVPQPPALVQVPNLWAQNQLVTVALLPPGAPTDGAQPLIDDLGRTYLRQFEDYARSRMFVTGPNTALADSLRREAGFTLTMPRVWYYRELEPGLLIFRNDQPDPSRLIRNITVDSRPSGEVPGSAEAITQWRADLATRLNQPPQVTEALPEVHTVQVSGRPALQVQGVWSNPPGEWPAAGPFIARMVECPDQTYLIDAWLYAPGTGKYEYMYQLNTILNSFECTRG